MLVLSALPHIMHKGSDKLTAPILLARLRKFQACVLRIVCWAYLSRYCMHFGTLPKYSDRRL